MHLPQLCLPFLLRSSHPLQRFSAHHLSSSNYDLTPDSFRSHALKTLRRDQVRAETKLIRRSICTTTRPRVVHPPLYSTAAKTELYRRSHCNSPKFPATLCVAPHNLNAGPLFIQTPTRCCTCGSCFTSECGARIACSIGRHVPCGSSGSMFTSSTCFTCRPCCRFFCSRESWFRLLHSSFCWSGGPGELNAPVVTTEGTDQRKFALPSSVSHTCWFVVPRVVTVRRKTISSCGS